MLTAYLDDSERHPVALLAGYVGYQKDWDAFEVEWEVFLARQQIPAYHSVECAHRKPGTPFAEWDVERCQRVHREAIEIITNHPIVALGRAVHLPNFRTMYDEKVAAAGKYAEPRPQYYTCLHWMLRVLRTIAQTREPPDAVQIVMDRMRGIEGRIRGFYDVSMRDSLRSVAPYLAGPPVFRSSRDCVQLQAADVLAYELSIGHSRSLTAEDTHPSRKSMEALREHAVQNSWQGMPLIRIDLEWERDEPSERPGPIPDHDETA